MKHLIAKIWKGALESPLDYPQLLEPDYLRRGDRFSPFGVLCEIYTSLKQGPLWGNSVDGIKTFLQHSCTLPTEVIEWAGLEEGEIRNLKGRSHREVAVWLQKTQTQTQVLC